MLLTLPRKHPVTGAMLTKACKQGLGLKPTATSASANMYQANQYCGEPAAPGTDMAVFVAAVWGHEGFGYNGGVGHETLGRAAASEPQNDPYKAIERFVYTDSVALANEVERVVVQINDDITLKAADSNSVNGGPKGNYTTPLNRSWEYY
jgi:hypothetical protein